MSRAAANVGSLCALLLACLTFQACSSLDPACGSSRPAPTITALSASTITLAQVQEGYVLTVTGAQFVSSTVGEINGTPASTFVVSSTELQMTLTSAAISAAGSATVTVNTPSGTSGDLGCTSGGTSTALVLDITS
jgi:hypothetical protein